MPLYAATLAPTASRRSATEAGYAPPGTKSPATLHELLRVRHVTQDDAHIYCTARIRSRMSADLLDYARYLYGLFGLSAPRRALDPARQQARHATSSGTGTSRPRERSKPTRSRTRSRRARARSTGRRSTSTWRTRSGASGSGHDSARLPDAVAVRADLVGADNAEHTLYVVHRALLRLARALHRHPDRALRRGVPLLARARAGADDPGGGGSPRGRRTRCAKGNSPVFASRSMTLTRPSASGSATPSSRRSRT